MKHEIIVNDGDYLIVVVNMPPSVTDPGNEIPAIARVYRVIASKLMGGSLLELLALGKAVDLTEQGFAGVVLRIEMQRSRKDV